MAEQKITVTNGVEQWTTTTSEYASMVANRPANMPKLTVVNDAPLDSVYENAEGDLVRDRLPAEQVELRARMGENVAATPERIEAQRRDQHKRTISAMADESNITSLTNAALPGAQFLQNLAVGKDAAAEARQQLSVNKIPGLVGNIAEFAIGGKALSLGFKGLLGAERAAKIGTKLGFGKEAGLVAKTGRVAAEDVAIETHLYTQGLLDRNQEFVAEDWANQVGVGLLLASPIIAGAGLRAGAQAVRRGFNAMGGSLPSVASSVGDIMTVGAVVSPVGGQAQRYARKAAAFHVGGRIARKVFGTRKGAVLGATDELAQQTAKHLDDMDTVGGLLPDKLDNMRPAKRLDYIEKFKAVADGDVRFLDEVEWGTLNKRTRKLGTEVSGMRQQMLGVYKRLRGEGVGVTMSKAARDRALTEANILMQYVDEAGMSDVKGAVQRAILKADADPGEMLTALLEAKVNARFRRGVSGGADLVDDAITRNLVDETIWGTAQATKNKTLLGALDDTVAIWDELGDINIPKYLEEIDVSDSLHLNNAGRAIDRARENLNIVRNNKLMTEAQLKTIETKLISTESALVEATKAYGDIVKINRARQSAAKLLQKRQAVSGAQIPTSQTSFAAQKAAMVAESAGELIALKSAAAASLVGKGLDKALNTKMQALAARGVGALHGMAENDKRLLFEEIQQELPTFTGNTPYAIDRLSKVLDKGAALDPVGADLAGAKTVHTIYYLAGNLPRPDDTVYGRMVPQPLSEVEEYLEKHIAAYDPLSVGFASIMGRVTPGMVDAVRWTNPAIYAEMRVAFAEALSQAEATKADPKVVSGISMFLGELDPMYTGGFLMNLQSAYAQTSTQDGIIRGGVNNIPNNSSPQDPRSGATRSQRLAS